MSFVVILTLLQLLIAAALTAVEDEGRIYGGRYAASREFPWMVFIRLTDELNCSGFLISENYVLTAAHCIIKPVNELSGKVGNIDRELGQDVSFESATIHPDFSNSTYYGDMVLLKLKNPVTFNEDVSRICLASESSFYDPNTPVLQMGWGSFTNTSKVVTRILKVTDIGRILDVGVCASLFDFFNASIPDSSVCVKNYGDDGVCEGDSGGPLVVKRGSQYTAIGLDSVGFYENCTVDTFFPEIFPDLLQHRQWILDETNSDICVN